MLEYKSYTGHAEFDAEAGLFHGEVLDTHDVITFQGTSVAELEKAFRDSIDDYLDFCADRGEEPDKAFSGRLMLRLRPELHRRVHLAARREGKSLNQWIADKLGRSTVVSS
ncbi:MAG: type II toxin-antitoxin system HicB family antitoxin [Acidobacteria bacterium]|nr:type II toxin-antitoxin system HicB family antitoxin [Acidobacteriota bacterium]